MRIRNRNYLKRKGRIMNNTENRFGEECIIDLDFIKSHFQPAFIPPSFSPWKIIFHKNLKRNMTTEVKTTILVGCSEAIIGGYHSNAFGIQKGELDYPQDVCGIGGKSLVEIHWNSHIVYVLNRIGGNRFWQNMGAYVECPDGSFKKITE